MNRTSHRFWLVIACLAVVLAAPRLAIASATFHLVETPVLDVRLNAEKGDNRT